MNPKCLGRAIPDTFSARSADLTGLKMRRITRAVSFDHLVGTAEERDRDGEAQRPGRFEVDAQLDFGGLLDGQIGRFLALENSARVEANQTVTVPIAASVAHQASG